MPVSYLVPVLFEGEAASGTVTTAVTSAITSAASEVTNMLSSNASTIIGVVVGFIVLAVGIKLIKKLRSAN